MKIVIKDVDFEFRCTYGFLRKLAEKWNCKGIGAIFKKLAKLEVTEDFEFEAIETLTDILQVAIEFSNKELSIDEDDVFKLIFEQPELIANVISEIAKSMPVQRNESSKKKAMKKS